jgi:hypothetical protein
MILGKVNCFNYLSFIDDIGKLFEMELCEDISIIIIQFIHTLYSNELIELNNFRSKKHKILIKISLNHNSFGFKFGGARNEKVGEKKMYGVFISDIKDNSAAKQYMINKNLDFKGFEIIKFNNLNINEKGTLKKLKDYQKSSPCYAMLIKLRWNPELLKCYNYL